jgi:hypothetical protein
MSEWWTYTLGDFLMFSPRVYWRLIERYNSAVWPAQVAVVLAGLAIAPVVRAPGPPQARMIAGALAAAWAVSGWGFLWARYASINWAARWLAGLFAVEALLLAAFAAREPLAFVASDRGRRAVGLGLYLGSVALFPLLSILGGRGWAGAEVFGLYPDPTAAGTIGLLLLVEDTAVRRALLLLPLLWCLVAALTLAALGAPHAWAPGVAALVAAAGLARLPARR